METFIELLELNLPTFFAGATELYRSSGDLKHIRKTKHKEMPSEDTLDVIKESKIYKMESEFYEFAATQFHWLKQELEQTKGGRFFHYEKIRPRP